jgi:hypothetical protein
MMPSAMVQADRQAPSIITFWPESRSASSLSRYGPIWPPRSLAIRTVADVGNVKIATNAVAITAVKTRIQSLAVTPAQRQHFTGLAGFLYSEFARPLSDFGAGERWPSWSS